MDFYNAAVSMTQLQRPQSLARPINLQIPKRENPIDSVQEGPESQDNIGRHDCADPLMGVRGNFC